MWFSKFHAVNSQYKKLIRGRCLSALIASILNLAAKIKSHWGRSSHVCGCSIEESHIRYWGRSESVYSEIDKFIWRAITAFTWWAFCRIAQAETALETWKQQRYSWVELHWIPPKPQAHFEVICQDMFVCLWVTSCEKSFLKLKLIKNFLRSTMEQSRLS